MDSGVLTAILAFLGTVIGTFGGILASASKTNFRLQQLEKKVEIHNQVVARVAVVENDIKTICRRLNNGGD